MSTRGFDAAHAIGGGNGELAVVWGAAPSGASVRVYWSDGQISMARVYLGVFLSVRSTSNIRTPPSAMQVDLLDAVGNVIDRRYLS